MNLEPPIGVRPETASDFAPVRAVVESAFSKSPLGYHGEADLIEALRSSCADLVSLVAERDGRIVGHVLFSPATIENGSAICRGMGLGPVAVLPKLQGLGIGTRLIRTGLEMLSERGTAFVCVFGYPAFYSRLGFQAAARFGLECEFGGGSDGTFQFVWLQEQPETFKQALLRYHPEFSRVGHDRATDTPRAPES